MSMSVSIICEDIRTIREQARLSQIVFAHYLNLTADYVSNWIAVRSIQRVRRSRY